MLVSNTLMFQYVVTSKVQISGKYSEYFFIIICSCLGLSLPKRTFFAFQTFCW